MRTISRLIDADALKTAIDDGWTPDMMVGEIWQIVDSMPTVTQNPKPKHPEKLPCPCGQKRIDMWISRGQTRFACPTCGRTSGWYDTTAEATIAWNMMVSHDE